VKKVYQECLVNKEDLEDQEERVKWEKMDYQDYQATKV